MSKYEELVRFIANDYLELSHEKVMSQRNYWRKLCEKLIREEHEKLEIMKCEKQNGKNISN